MKLLITHVIFFWQVSVNAEVIHEERSLYQNILVTQRGDRLCLQFTVRRVQRNQSCMNTRNPKQMVLTYTRMMMSGLLIMPNPENILIVGLGGGTLVTVLTELIPTAYVDVVEIDPAVYTVARKFFNYAPTKNTRVILQDARVFTKRAASKSRRYDLIMLDAFNGDYIPEHLMTREYLQETRAILSDRGVVVANTFSTSRLYDHESETYFQVFGPFINFTSGTSGNRIVLASGSSLATNNNIKQLANDWQNRLEPYNVPISSFPKNFDRGQNWDRSRRVLTDQYSPANLLRGFD